MIKKILNHGVRFGEPIPVGIKSLIAQVTVRTFHKRNEQPRMSAPQAYKLLAERLASIDLPDRFHFDTATNLIGFG